MSHKFKNNDSLKLLVINTSLTFILSSYVTTNRVVDS